MSVSIRPSSGAWLCPITVAWRLRWNQRRVDRHYYDHHCLIPPSFHSRLHPSMSSLLEASTTSLLSSATSIIPSATPSATIDPVTSNDPVPAHHANPVVAFIIGLAIVLLASILNAAGLNLTKLDHVSPGFRCRGVLMLTLQPGARLEPVLSQKLRERAIG